jgi:mono/diheme cytochrome c family protein
MMPGLLTSRGRAALIAGALGVAVTAVAPVRAAEPPPPIAWTPATVSVTPGQPRGYVAFQLSCAVCHGSGPGKPGTRALAAKYKGTAPALLEQRTDLAPDYVRTVVRHGVSVMPIFRKTELSDADLDAIAAYLNRKQR